MQVLEPRPLVSEKTVADRITLVSLSIYFRRSRVSSKLHSSNKGLVDHRNNAGNCYFLEVKRKLLSRFFEDIVRRIGGSADLPLIFFSPPGGPLVAKPRLLSRTQMATIKRMCTDFRGLRLGHQVLRGIKKGQIQWRDQCKKYFG